MLFQNCNQRWATRMQIPSSEKLSRADNAPPFTIPSLTHGYGFCSLIFDSQSSIQQNQAKGRFLQIQIRLILCRAYMHLLQKKAWKALRKHILPE